MAIIELSPGEQKAKKRLFSLGGVASHLGHLFELFVHDESFTEAERRILSSNGGFFYCGFCPGWGVLDSEIADVVVRWILTGDEKCYEILKVDFLQRARQLIDFCGTSPLNTERGKSANGKTGYIYVIKSQGFYKIGRTRALGSRLRPYISENPLSIEVVFTFFVYDCMEVERILHLEFESKQERGEWFLLDDSDLVRIQRLVSEYMMEEV